jgi:hypothetical protein
MSAKHGRFAAAGFPLGALSCTFKIASMISNYTYIVSPHPVD